MPQTSESKIWWATAVLEDFERYRSRLKQREPSADRVVVLMKYDELDGGHRATHSINPKSSVARARVRQRSRINDVRSIIQAYASQGDRDGERLSMRAEAIERISAVAGTFAQITSDETDLRNALAKCAQSGDNAWDFAGLNGLYLIATYRAD
jgi:hypothetical protein